MTCNFLALKEKVMEYLKFDFIPARFLSSISSVFACEILRIFGKKERALSIAMYMHRNAVARPSDSYAEWLIGKLIARGDDFRIQYIERLAESDKSRRFFRQPEKLIGSRITVVKEALRKGKGVIIVDYSFTFPLVARKFDITKIFERYHVVLEPSWSGVCDNDLLALSAFGPVFVQTNEPRDILFLKKCVPNVTPVPIAANWWVDTRIFQPLSNVIKDADFFVNASWAKFKRHDRLFSIVADARRRGIYLRGILVGYPNDLTMQEIRALAEWHGIADQFEFHENVKPQRVNELLNRCRVNVIWSRREGSNRAIVEGLSAGIPGILRRGFNYGHRYPFIEGGVVSLAGERELTDCIMTAGAGKKGVGPRTWVECNMSPQLATQKLEEVISRWCCEHGEKWSDESMAVKVSALHSMEYWDQRERQRFDQDYAFIRSLLR